MKLQKLVYISHGFHLAFFDEPLIDEDVEAWKFGPVIRSLYREFADYGSGPIVEKARVFDGTTMKNLEISISDTPPPESHSHDETAELLDDVWDHYGGLHAVQLSKITHREGSPWEQVWNPDARYIRITDDIIKEHYKELTADG